MAGRYTADKAKISRRCGIRFVSLEVSFRRKFSLENEAFDAIYLFLIFVVFWATEFPRLCLYYESKLAMYMNRLEAISTNWVRWKAEKSDDDALFTTMGNLTKVSYLFLEKSNATRTHCCNFTNVVSWKLVVRERLRWSKSFRRIARIADIFLDVLAPTMPNYKTEGKPWTGITRAVLRIACAIRMTNIDGEQRRLSQNSHRITRIQLTESIGRCNQRIDDATCPSNRPNGVYIESGL